MLVNLKGILVLSWCLLLAACGASLETSNSRTFIAGKADGHLVELSSTISVTPSNLRLDRGRVVPLALPSGTDQFYALSQITWGEFADRPCFFEATYRHLFNSTEVQTVSLPSANCFRLTVNNNRGQSVTPNSTQTVSLTTQQPGPSGSTPVFRYANAIGVCETGIPGDYIDDTVLSGSGTDNIAYDRFRIKGITLEGSLLDGSNSNSVTEMLPNCRNNRVPVVNSCASDNFIGQVDVIFARENPLASGNDPREVAIGLQFHCMPVRRSASR